VTLQARDFHILSGTTHRTASLHGRDHIVVPIIALMEGVIRPVNGVGNEFVPADEIAKALQAWNGRPIMPDHPRTADGHVSANHPDVIAQSFGQVFNARFENNKLLMDAYIDPEKAKEVGASAQLDKILAGDAAEVSVGVYVAAEKRKGNFAGKPFDVIWHQIVPDHLAILPAGTRGACSVEMGCGTNRAAAVYDFEEETVEEPVLEVAAFDKAAYMKAYNAHKKGGGRAPASASQEAIAKLKPGGDHTIIQHPADKHGHYTVRQHADSKQYTVLHHGGGTYPTHITTTSSPEKAARAINTHANNVAYTSKGLRTAAFDKKAYMAAYNAKKKNPGQHAGTQKAIAHSMAEKAKAVNKPAGSPHADLNTGSKYTKTIGGHAGQLHEGENILVPHPQGHLAGGYRIERKTDGSFHVSTYTGPGSAGAQVGTTKTGTAAAALVYHHGTYGAGKKHGVPVTTRMKSKKQ